MKAERAGRIGAWLAGAWTGEIAAVGFVAAPALFSTLSRGDAGRIASRLFELDAMVGLAAGALLVVLTSQLARMRAERQQPSAEGGSRSSVELGLTLGALACIVAGYYALQPVMEAARLGQGALSFGALHAISMAFFAVRLVLAGVLAWRLGLRAAD